MRQLTLLAILIFFTFTALGQEKSIRLEKGTFPLKVILETIQQQQKITIFYSDEIVHDEMLYNITKDRISIDVLLKDALTSFHLDYQKIDNKMIIIHAQPNSNKKVNNTLKGVVLDSEGNVVPFATIRLFSGNHLLEVSNTIDDGTYALRASLELGKSYLIQVSALNYKGLSKTFQYPDTNRVNRIILQQEANVLEAVEIQGKTSPFSRVADRLIVNVEGTMLENGLSTLDILQQSPGLWVNANGEIKIRGNQSVRVMINDIPQRMSADQLAEYLRNLPSESIKKIEIIPNPGAEYEAEGSGGIVRIQLRRNINDGFKANLLTRYLQQNKDPYLNSGAILDFKRDRLYVTAVGAYLRDDQTIFANYDVSYPDNSKYLSNTDRFRSADSYNTRIAASYDIRENQSISMQTVWIGGAVDQIFNTTNAHILESESLRKNTSNSWDTHQNMLNTTVNYNLKLDSIGSSLKVIADYLANDHNESNDYTMLGLDTKETERYKNLSPNLTEIYSLQTDFARYYSSTNLNWAAGIKFVGTDRYNEVLRNNFVIDQWIKDPLLSNEFQYRENLFMGYAALNYKINKTSIKAGLRAEETNINALSITNSERIKQAYLSWFPSLYFLQEIGPKENYLYLNYAKRLNRPSFKDLNPYTLQFDDFVVMRGNAALTPEYIHKIETGYSLKNGLTAELYFAYTQDKIALFMESIDNKTLAYQSRNFDSSVNYGASIFAPWNIKRWWSAQANVAWYRTRFEFDNINLSQHVGRASLSQTFKFKDLLDANIYLGYTSSTYVVNTKYADQFHSIVRLSKDLLQKKAKITFMWNDVFNASREREITSHQGTVANFYQKRPTQTFGLSFSYTISKGKKFENKKIEQSNIDEKNRAN